MRKNTVKKWIFGAIKCLPLLVIPIFAIYSQRHTIENNSVVVGGYDYVEKYSSNDVFSSSDLVEGNVYHLTIDNSALGSIYFNLSFTFLSGDFNYHIYNYQVAKTNVSLSNNYDLTFSMDDRYASLKFNNEGLYQLIQIDTFSIDCDIIFHNIDGVFGNWVSCFSLSNFNIVESVYNDELTYNDTDIGSQFIYQMYNVTDKYFNFTNMFNLASVRDWLVLNMFGGNAPLTINIVWNILVYEIFIDLILLMYCILTFVVEVATNMLDSFTRRNGGR